MRKYGTQTKLVAYTAWTISDVKVETLFEGKPKQTDPTQTQSRPSMDPQWTLNELHTKLLNEPKLTPNKAPMNSSMGPFNAKA